MRGKIYIVQTRKGGGKSMLKDRLRIQYRKELKGVIVIIMALSMLVAFILPASAAPAADKIGVVNECGYKNTCVTVPVNITNVTNGPIGGIDFNISYNKSVINVTGVQEGDLTSDWHTLTGKHYDWGTWVFGSVGEGTPIGNGAINDSVVLLNFSVLGAPGETSYMNLWAIYFYNDTGTPLDPAPPQNGTFTVGGAQAWYLHNDTKMYKGNMSKPEGTLAIPDGNTTNWTANEAATVDVKFPAGNWTGWLTLNTPFATDENFTVAVGSYNTTTSDFSSAGTQIFIGESSKTAFALDISAEEFTVPNGNNLSLNVTNPSAGSADLVIKTGAGNSFITSPETDPGYPVPELSTTILFSVGLLALAAYILRPRFLKR